MPSVADYMRNFLIQWHVGAGALFVALLSTYYAPWSRNATGK